VFVCLKDFGFEASPSATERMRMDYLPIHCLLMLQQRVLITLSINAVSNKHLPNQVFADTWMSWQGMQNQ